MNLAFSSCHQRPVVMDFRDDKMRFHFTHPWLFFGYSNGFAHI